MQKDNSEGLYNQAARKEEFSCSIGFAMTVIGSKWRAIILWHILEQPQIRAVFRIRYQISHTNTLAENTVIGVRMVERQSVLLCKAEKNVVPQAFERGKESRLLIR